MKKTVLSLLIASASVLIMQGCSAMNTALGKSDLKVTTKMSETIFLEPVDGAKQTVYVKVRNTSDKDLSDLQKIIEGDFIAQGFKIVKSPSAANFMIQANVLYVDNANIEEANKYMQSGFGGAIVGGVAVGAATGSAKGAAAGAGIGALIGMASEYFVSDEFYSMVTDLQVRERPLNGEKVTQNTYAKNKNGSNSATTQITTGAESKWKIYRARVLSSANQMNLEFKDAKLPLSKDLAGSIVGVF